MSGVLSKESLEKCKILYRDVDQARASERTQALISSLESSDFDDHYTQLSPAIALGLPLKPRKFNISYPDYPLLPELFPTFFPGIKTSRDDVVTDIDRQELVNRIEQYFDLLISHEEMSRIAPNSMMIENRAKAEAIRDQLRKRGILQDNTVKHSYRPFDTRWLYWELETKLLDRNRSDCFSHVFDRNLWIVSQQKPRRDWSKPQFIRYSGGLDLMDRGASCIPLFLKPEEGKLDLFSNDDRKLENGLNLNLSDKAILRTKFEQVLGLKPSSCREQDLFF